jgi:hypothetical protein
LMLLLLPLLLLLRLLLLPLTPLQLKTVMLHVIRCVCRKPITMSLERRGVEDSRTFDLEICGEIIYW